MVSSPLAIIISELVNVAVGEGVCVGVYVKVGSAMDVAVPVAVSVKVGTEGNVEVGGYITMVFGVGLA
jgi:hypothetical protein